MPYIQVLRPQYRAGWMAADKAKSVACTTRSAGVCMGQTPYETPVGEKIFYLYPPEDTMANPTWFNYEAYMNNKLAQMKATDANYSMDQLFSDFAKAGFAGAEGAYNHFVQFGADEEVAPNAYFNAKEYYIAKAVDYYTKQGVTVTAATISDFQVNTVKQLIDQAGMNAWTHYEKFGSSEGVNPSNAFDAAAYCAAKAAVMGGTWDAKGVMDAITAAHMTVLEHFMQYAGTGADEITADQ